MRKILVVSGLVLLFGAIPLIVLAQTTPDPQSSHVHISNLSSEEATVVVNVYDSQTGILEATANFTIAGGAKMAVHATAGTDSAGHRYLDLPSGFSGSMVVSSDKEVVAITNIAGGNPFTSYCSYEGVSSDGASPTVFIPSIHWRDKQWAMVAMQNTGSVNASVTYTYTLQDGTVINSNTVTVQPGRSEIRNVYSDIDIGTWTDGFGSMLVTSNEPVAVATWETLNKYTNAYIGFPESYGDTTVYFSSIHHNLPVHHSHILVQNMDDALAATVTLTYSHPTGAVANVYNATIDAGGALTFHTNGAASSDGISYEPTNLGNVGNAVITSDQPIIAAVREVMGGKPYAFNGFRSDAGGTTLFYPSVHKNPAGQFSHLLVQNLSPMSNTIQLEYYKADGTLDSTFTKELGPGGSINFHTNDVASPDGLIYSPTSGYGNVGTAKVISLDSRPIVGLNTEVLRGIPNNYAGFAQ
jgi:hypothetical protein